MTATFESHLRDGLEALDIDLPHPLWLLIAWLEENGHRHVQPTSAKTVLPVMPRDSEGELWSHLFFDLQTDVTRFWLNCEGMERSLIPFLHCGADGSYMALWRHSGAPDRFVFLGSEGEAFVLAEDVTDFITLITMGYTSIEGSDVLFASPEENWADFNDGPWPDAPALHTWARETFGINYPATGAALLPYAAEADPFATWVSHITEG